MWTLRRKRKKPTETEKLKSRLESLEGFLGVLFQDEEDWGEHFIDAEAEESRIAKLMELLKKKKK